LGWGPNMSSQTLWNPVRNPDKSEVFLEFLVCA
jgi:hypothetical protein